MRRLTVLALVAIALVVLPAAVAVADVAAEPLVLAVEAGEPLGPDPQPRDAEGNAATELAGYEDRDVPFTWGAAWILSALGLGGIAAGALFYRFRVKAG